MNTIAIDILIYIVLSYILNYIFLRIQIWANGFSNEDKAIVVFLFYISPITLFLTTAMTIVLAVENLCIYFSSAYKAFLYVKEKFEDFLFPFPRS